MPTDYNIYPFTLTIDAENWPIDVADELYQFNVEIKCDVLSLTIVD